MKLIKTLAIKKMGCSTLLWLITISSLLHYTCKGQEPTLVMPIGHTDRVDHGQFSPDGKYAVTASDDHTAIIWDARTGTLIRTLQGHTQGLMSVHYSPDGKNIITSSVDHTSRIWDASTGATISVLQDPKDKVRYANYNPAGTQIITLSLGNVIQVWDAATGNVLYTLEGHRARVLNADFSPGGKYALTLSEDKTVKIWNAADGTLRHTIERGGKPVTSAVFSPDESQVATVTNDSVYVWDATTAAIIGAAKLPGAESAQYSPNGKQLLLTTNNTINLWDISTAKPIRLIYKTKEAGNTVTCNTYSKDGRHIAAAFSDKTVRTWDATTGMLLQTLKGHTEFISSVSFSPDGKRILTTSGDKTGRIWSTVTGACLSVLRGYTRSQWSALYSPDGNYIATPSCWDSTVTIWSSAGKLLQTLKGHTDIVLSAAWSPDSRYLATSSRDFTAKIWNLTTGKIIMTFKGHNSLIWGIAFSPDGQRVATASNDKTARIWDVATGRQVAILNGHTNWVNTIAWSPDGKKVVTSAWDGNIKVWNAVTGTEVKTISEGQNLIWDAVFSPDGKYLLTSDTWEAKIWDEATGTLVHTLQAGKIARYSADGKYIATGSTENSAKIWNAATGELMHTLNGHGNKIRSVSFSPDSKHLLTCSDDNTNKLWNVATGQQLFSFFSVKNGGYLVADNNGRYDGSSDARKLLYFACGMEIIALEQVKDQLWVPNLATRLLSGETVNAKKINELGICDLTPEIEETNDGRGGLYYKITPHRGGLGEVIVYVNGIETKRYTAAKLNKPADYYELPINKEDLKEYLQEGRDNKITVKAFTIENEFASRGLDINLSAAAPSNAHANLYAIVIGVSDYKDPDMRLRYAAKDATDICAAIKASGARLLGADHVFTYMLTTAAGRYMLPEKEGIKKTLEDISKKAKANDILFIFFAGHGVMESKSGQFYFLPPAATRTTANDAPASVGISAQELATWLQPSKMKAQKRVLILDACHSGQAINNIVQEQGGYIAARGDEQAQEARALDKLNERSGMFILAASASNQSAYESGRYAQGLLTYALLHAIKLQPDILEGGKYLDVGRWLSAAEKMVSALAAENGARQQPQIVSAGNFAIGMVDAGVTSAIHLPQEKPLFGACNFQNNDATIADDDLLLSKTVNKRLGDISARGADAEIMYSGSSNLIDPWTLSGRYTLTGNVVKVNVNIRHADEVKYKIEVTGSNSDIDDLAGKIADAAIKKITGR